MAGNRRRWWILGLGMAAQAASCVFIYGLPYLLPELRRAFGITALFPIAAALAIPASARAAAAPAIPERPPGETVTR